MLYAVAQIQLHPDDWWKRWSYLPVLTLLGTGICLKNSIAVWQGLSQTGGQFLRTPKFRVEATGDRWQQSNYRLAIEGVTVGELILTLYALLTVVTALMQGRWWTALFPLIYVGGFGVMIFVALWQAQPVKTGQSETYRRRSEPPLLPVEPEFPCEFRIPCILRHPNWVWGRFGASGRRTLSTLRWYFLVKYT